VKAVADARKAGTVVVVSAGNGAFRDADRKQCDCERGENGACKNVQCKKIPIDIKQYSPAGCPGVISVGATDKFGHITYYSNYGGLTVMAPGGDTRFLNDEKGNRVTDPQTYCPGRTCYTSEGVLSAIKGGYGWYQGTSQAAPHVSGALALALVAHPEWRGKPDVIEQKLRDSLARAPQGACPADKPCGPGLLDAGKLVAQQGMVRSMIERVRSRNKGVTETLPAGR
jgi:serine protease